MAFDLKRLLAPIIDLSAEGYEEHAKELIVFGALVVLALIVIWKRS
jgi:hypothetical protein